MIWPVLALFLGLAAVVGAGAALRAHHRSKIALAKWKRRAERTHQYFENMRRATQQQ